MNKKLYNDFGKRIDAIIIEKNRIKSEYEGKSVAEKRFAQAATQEALDNLNYEKNILVDAREKVKSAYNALKNSITREEEKKAREELDKANLNMYIYATKFNIPYDKNDEVELSSNGKVVNRTETAEVKNVSEPSAKLKSKSRIILPLVLSGVLATGWFGHEAYHHDWFDKIQVVEHSQNDDTKTEKYGMTTKLTDASDEKQVMARAQEIYNLYVNSADVTEETKRELSVERLANIIRMCNGEFALEDGEVRYSRGENDVTSFTELGNWINCYSNSTSFENYKNQLRFKPLSVFFEEDTDAYAIAVKADGLVKNIYDDIRANDVAKFTEDAKAWGEFVKYTVIHNDFNQNYMSLWSINTEQQYPLLKTITTTFAPSTLEYAINVDLATRNNSFGNTFGICIPYCYENGAMTEKPLSQLVYDINETPMNSLAERVGRYEEWASRNNPIMDQVGYACKAWFDSKYDREIGYSRILK